MTASIDAKVDRIQRDYHQILDSDTHEPPASYRRDAPFRAGPTRVPVERYTSQAFHDLEVERLWRRVWQFACHEDDIPEVGDFVPYDIAGLSFLVVRTANTEIKAFYNACLHRGRKLREFAGRAAEDLKCPFHGWTWDLAGNLKHVPCAWDFHELHTAEQRLPEARVAVWGRFVFINPDADCESFESFVGDLSSHFQVLPYDRLYKSAHVAKIIACNWKVASEAFMESYHVVGTHPQILLGGPNDVDTKYDVFGNYSRAIRCGALDSDGLPQWGPLLQDGRPRIRHPLNGYIYEASDDGLVQVTAPDGRTGLFDRLARPIAGDLGDVSPHLCEWVCGEPKSESAPANVTSEAGATGARRHPRALAAESQRQALRDIIGTAAEQIADVEFSPVFFTLFPNFHPWGSFNGITYRFRPNGNDPDSCIMECIYLKPIPADGRYQPARDIRQLGVDDPWTDAVELGALARIFAQDTRNLKYVQQGLHATTKRTVQFARYNESKPRHFHMLLEHWLAES